MPATSGTTRRQAPSRAPACRATALRTTSGTSRTSVARTKHRPAALGSRAGPIPARDRSRRWRRTAPAGDDRETDTRLVGCHPDRCGRAGRKARVAEDGDGRTAQVRHQRSCRTRRAPAGGGNADREALDAVDQRRAGAGPPVPADLTRPVRSLVTCYVRTSVVVCAVPVIRTSNRALGLPASCTTT
jgi:hypothetical protein